MIRRFVHVAVTSYTLLWALAVNAADATDPNPRDFSGKALRELEKQPELSVPKTTPPLRPTPSDSVPAEPISEPSKQPTPDIRLPVKSILISGNTVITTSELEKQVAYLIGEQHTLSELNDGAARITKLYHDRGYVISRAYIPPQEIKGGIVEISVQEGRVGKGRIYNLSRLEDRTTYEFLSTIRSGAVLQADPIERSLLLLNETPGVAAAKAVLQPGASVGTADVVVELSPSTPYTAEIKLDNYGNYYTGQNRLGAEVAVNSPLKIGDLLSLRALTAGNDLKYAYFAYQVPIGGNGLRMGISHSSTQYRLGRELDNGTHGSATVGSLFAYYPFIRSHKGNLAGTFTLENKLLSDVLASTTAEEKQVRLATFALSGDHSDKLNGGGVNLASLSVSRGTMGFDANTLALGGDLANTAGSFYRVNYNFNRLQRLSDRNSLSLAISGQKANKNLNSSEDFALGGANGVRAYPQGEAMGDEGQLANLELRHEFLPNVQGVLFYDVGSVKINHTPYVVASFGQIAAAPPNARSLSGAGIGVNAKLFDFEVKAYYAQRGSGGTPTAEPEVLDRKARVWLQVGKKF